MVSNVVNMTSANKIKISKKVVRAKSTTSLPYKRLFVARPDVLHQYLRHQNINQYLEYIKQRYPSFVEVYTLGGSYEGRLLKGIEIDWNSDRNVLKQTEKSQSIRSKSAPIKISNGSDSPTLTTHNKRNIIFIEGGTHGREWLTISVALNIVYQLTEKHTRNTSILKKFRFFIVPISNPDGYEYTLDKNLRWRKNRRPTSPSCKHFGIDCNRNYDFHWDKGSAKASCCTYKGEKPFSESETRALSTTLQKLGPDLLLFISLHSYAQAIMYPWGFTREPAENIKELQAVASAGSYAVKAYSGRTYRTGSISKLSSHVIGGSIVDYAYGIIKVPYAYVMELPDSSYGFQPPPEVIRPVGEESWIGIREMCYCAQKLYTSRPTRPSVLHKMQKKYGQSIGLTKHTIYGTEASKTMHTAS